MFWEGREVWGPYFVYVANLQGGLAFHAVRYIPL